MNEAIKVDITDENRELLNVYVKPKLVSLAFGLEDVYYGLEAALDSLESNTPLDFHDLKEIQNTITNYCFDPFSRDFIAILSEYASKQEFKSLVESTRVRLDDEWYTCSLADGVTNMVQLCNAADNYCTGVTMGTQTPLVEGSRIIEKALGVAGALIIEIIMAFYDLFGNTPDDLNTKDTFETALDLCGDTFVPYENLDAAEFTGRYIDDSDEEELEEGDIFAPEAQWNELSSRN